MKRLKLFLLVIAGTSFFFITGCTTMQNIPYDDVYYSTAKGAPQVAQNNTTVNEPAHYKIAKVQSINTNQQNPSSTNTKQVVYTIDTVRTDTIKTANLDSVVYSNINTGLGFNNSNFGTGFSSWTLGGYGGAFGYNNYWYDPSWYDFYFPYSYPYYGYPYYYNYPFYSYGGWGFYGYGYPYWGFGFTYPYYGYSYGYPYYYGYSPYYNNRYTYYGHRRNMMGGTHILPVGKAVPYSRTKSSRAEILKRTGVGSTTTGQATYKRPEGSMRYQKALNNLKATRVGNKATAAQKAPIYRPNNRAVPVRKFQKPAYSRPNMATPRYQKPKQYQSLDARQARSSKEYFRPQPQTIVNGKTKRVNTTLKPQRFNIYRPTNNKSHYYRPTNRNSWTRTTRSTPVRHYNAPVRYSSPSYNRSTTNRSYNPTPARVPTGGGSRGGGGTRSGGGGGNIRH